MSNDNTVFVIEDLRLELDLNDADDAENYEKAFKRMTEAHKELAEQSSELSAADKIRSTCRIYRELIDNIFGEGTSAKITSMQKNNARKHEEVVEALVEFVNVQAASNNARRNEFMAKYRPSGRRNV